MGGVPPGAPPHILGRAALDGAHCPARHAGAPGRGRSRGVRDGGGGLIPIPLSSDRREPVEGTERANAAWFAAKPCPRGTAGGEDGIVGRPEAVREEALAQVE